MGPFATASAQIYLKLKERILSGELRPGTHLVRRQVAAEYGTSPIPVIEALLRLEMDGLVESEPKYGARVRLMAVEEIRDEQVFREAIECEAARRFSTGASPRAREELSALAGALDRVQHGSDPQSLEANRAHRDFHLFIARSGGHPNLERELARLWYWMVGAGWVDPLAYPTPVDWHAQLARSLGAGSADRAEAAMREHVNLNREAHLAALLSRFG
ncbi:MAG: GntR family transcriptional regulator [Spirochaetes bacterium]|nr:GntR family transcriptional regulator [Spirochaetota bacterium]